MKRTSSFRHFKLLIFVGLGIILTQDYLPLNDSVFAQNSKSFKDIKGHWAQTCIEELAQKNIVKGDYEEDTFRPNDPINRAEFAALLSQAFPKRPRTKKVMDFIDVPTDYWAYRAIQDAYQKGFLSGYLGSVFNPLLNIPRVQALVALVNGLDYKPSQISPQQLTKVFEDGADIPEYARSAIATATENWLVINYPQVRRLNPNKPATRAEVATFICQAISEDHKQALVPTQYIARIALSETPEVASEPTKPTEPQQQPTRSAPAVVMQPQGTSPIESRPESYPETKDLKVQRTANLGEVKAELLADSNNTIQLMLIKISRKGDLVSEEVVPMASLSHPGVKTVKTGRVMDFKVIDLDNDKEPEVLVDVLINGDNNLNHYYSVIYRYSPIKEEYRDFVQKWGVASYRLNTEKVETPILIHYDQRFSQEFQTYTPEQLPLQIFKYQFGELQDATQQYPELVKEHHSVLLQEINKRRRLKQDLKAVVAAYLAQQYLLGNAEIGWKTVEEIYQNPDKNQFFPQLRQWLEKTGYSQRSR